MERLTNPPSQIPSEMLSNSKCNEFSSFFSEKINNIRKEIGTSSSYSSSSHTDLTAISKISDYVFFEAIDSKMITDSVTKSMHAMSLRGKSACTVSLFSVKKLCSRLSLFSRKEGQPSTSRNSGPTAAEAQRRMKSWGSQLDLADELERNRPFSCASAENESELLDCDAIFLTSSDSAASALLGYAQEEQEMFKGEEVETEPTQSSCTAYDELLEVMDHKIIFLAINPQLERAFLSS